MQTVSAKASQRLFFRMAVNFVKLKISLQTTYSSFCLRYTRKCDTNWRDTALLLISCLVTSLILAFLILLSLKFVLNYGTEVSVAVAGVFCFFLTTAMWLSQRFRCFGILLLLSISLKHGRNLLITTGTTVVIFLNVHNTLTNLRGLARSLLCTMKEKLVTADLAPLSNYIRMLHWVAAELKKGLPVVSFRNHFTNFTLNTTVHSQNFTNKLAEAERTLNETAESILAVIDTSATVARHLSPLFGVAVLVIITALYLKRFRCNREQDNIFITRNFLQYDEKQQLEGKVSVFPLSAKESQHYVVVPSAGLTRKEAKAMFKFSIPIMTHSLAWLFFVAVDGLVFWVITILKGRLEELEPLHVPVELRKEDGTFFLGATVQGAEEVFNFSYNMSVFERKCLPVPELWLSKSLQLLAVILCVLVLLVVISSKLDQIRLLVSEQFFTDVAEERIAALHAKILSKRSGWKSKTVKTALKSFATGVRFWFPILLYRRKRNHEQIP